MSALMQSAEKVNLSPWHSMIVRWVKSSVFPTIVRCPAIVGCSIGITIKCPGLALDAQLSPWMPDWDLPSNAQLSHWMISSCPGCSIGIYRRMLDWDLPSNTQLLPWMLYWDLPLNARLEFTIDSQLSLWMPSSRPGCSIGITIE